MHESLPDVAELRSWVPVFVYERKDRILGLSCSRVTDSDLEVVPSFWRAVSRSPARVRSRREKRSDARVHWPISHFGIDALS